MIKLFKLEKPVWKRSKASKLLFGVSCLFTVSSLSLMVYRQYFDDIVFLLELQTIFLILGLLALGFYIGMKDK